MEASLKKSKKLHPKEVLLFAGLGSIVMAFAGLTSAYIVKKSQSNWLQFDLPNVFWVSTIVILISSFTIQMAVKKAKENNINQYKGFLWVTLILGLSFVFLQIQGFFKLEAENIALIGSKSNPASSFLFVIVVLHLIHILGGVIALLFVSFRAHKDLAINKNILPIRLASTYWHFVDLLWIYLFVFIGWIG